MRIKRTYGCQSCGATWQFLHMTEKEPPQPCPNGCVTKPTTELSAPAVGRNAVPTGLQVPTTQSGREQMAGDLALKGTGMGDVTANQKIGDIAAKSVPIAPDVPASLREQMTPKFMDYKGGMAQAASDPYKQRNMGLIGSGSKMPRLQDISTKHYPTKRG